VIEDGFVKYANDSNIFIDTIAFVLNEYHKILIFPYSDHQIEIMTNIFQYLLYHNANETILLSIKTRNNKVLRKRNCQNE
jgi:hypothetical protein